MQTVNYHFLMQSCQGKKSLGVGLIIIIQKLIICRGVGRIFESRGQINYEYIIANGGGGLCVFIN